LLRLRRPDDTRTLWVDAICVDQLNIPERNSQVSIMQKLYATAEQVVIWLGAEKEDGSTGWAFQMIPILAKLSSDELKQYVMDNTTPGAMSEEFRNDFLSLRRLVQRPWWQRVWVIQEFVVARETVLLYGPHELDWQGLRDLHKMTQNLRKLAREPVVYRARLKSRVNDTVSLIEM
jgi:hypothetical protein